MTMTTTAKATTLSELIHRTVSSGCLNNPLSHCHSQRNPHSSDSSATSSEHQPISEDEGSGNNKDNDLERSRTGEVPVEVEELMEEVFSSVAAMKKAYVSLQAAHSPWDPDRILAADESVVAELGKLSRLKNRFRRCQRTGNNPPPPPPPPPPPAPLREAVIPYEAALREARKELKAKEAEIENLRDKLKSAVHSTTPPSRRKGRLRSSSAARRKSLISSSSVGPNPTPELFLSWAENQVKTSCRAFAGLFMASMKSSGVDVRSLVSSPSVGSHHWKHAIEAYVNRRTFHGFENETFYMEGTLSSLLDPSAHRRDCFSQFKSMLSMDPSELLGVLPTCRFGNWAAKTYRSIVGDGSRAGDLFGEFLSLAKAVWLLHLLAFAIDPAPTHFEAMHGAEFDGDHMESVVRFPGEKVPLGWVVGFGVGPGFTLGDGSVVRTRVYPVPPSQ